MDGTVVWVHQHSASAKKAIAPTLHARGSWIDGRSTKRKAGGSTENGQLENSSRIFDLLHFKYFVDKP